MIQPGREIRSQAIASRAVNADVKSLKSQLFSHVVLINLVLRRFLRIRICSASSCRGLSTYAPTHTHTAPRCNILQHAHTHRMRYRRASCRGLSALARTYKHSNSLHHTAPHYTILQHTHTHTHTHTERNTAMLQHVEACLRARAHTQSNTQQHTQHTATHERAHTQKENPQCFIV